MAGQLLAVAFLILLAGFPFHIWLQPVVSVGRPLTLVLVLGLGQILLLVFVYEWLAAYPWIHTAVPFRRLIQWSSGLTALTAGVLAVTMPSLRRLLGSLLLLDMSVSLAMLLVPVETGWETAVLLPLVRSVSLLLVVLGKYGLPAADQTAAAWRGSGRQRPIAALTLGYGLFSLLGLPLGVGFPGRWSAIVLIAAADVSFWLPVGLLLATGGGIYGLWRGLSPLLMRGEKDAAVRQPIVDQVGLLLGLAAGVVLAVTPLGLSFIQRLALLWLRAG